MANYCLLKRNMKWIDFLILCALIKTVYEDINNNIIIIISFNSLTRTRWWSSSNLNSTRSRVNWAKFIGHWPKAKQFEPDYRPTMASWSRGSKRVMLSFNRLRRRSLRHWNKWKSWRWLGLGDPHRSKLYSCSNNTSVNIKPRIMAVYKFRTRQIKVTEGITAYT